MSLSPAKEVAVPGVTSIVFGSSWEYGCGLGVVESWSRLCLAFRFFARSVTPESNWVRFGPQSLPALVHLVHFSCTLSSHLRSDGLHYPLSDLRLGKDIKTNNKGKRGWGGQSGDSALATRQTECKNGTPSPFVLQCDTDRIFYLLYDLYLVTPSFEIERDEAKRQRGHQRLYV
jgi:hypothetical protein